MRVIDPGHSYELNMLDSARPNATIRLFFVKREGSRFPGNVGHHHGTTSQEVLRALIDRAWYVTHQIPCWQTRLSILLMGAVVWLYEHRAAGLHHRTAPSFRDAIYGACCPKCGHVGCEETE